MRPILPLLVFLMLAPAARAEGVLLTRAGRTETLRVAPQTLGNRSSWDGDPASLTFAFDATGRDGVYGLTVSLSGGRATSVILWLPEGRYLAMEALETRLSPVQIDGPALHVAGHTVERDDALRLEFDLVLPTIDFAPTPGPGPDPQD